MAAAVGSFQSLNWDGVISNAAGVDDALTVLHVSIPQLGWGDFKPGLRGINRRVGGLFQSLNWDGVISNWVVVGLAGGMVAVSIPQLGWGDFKLFVWTIVCAYCKFQSLNWDGVISNAQLHNNLGEYSVFQSLNWDGVISNLRDSGALEQDAEFQSLNWDGVISNMRCRQSRRRRRKVSIPQLGWGDFKHAGHCRIDSRPRVSIPQLGWGDFKLRVAINYIRYHFQFQSLNWDGVISNFLGVAA